MDIPIHSDGLSSHEVLRLTSVIAIGMTMMMASVSSYFLERRYNHRPMFAVVLMLIAWCTLTLGSAMSGLGRLFPFLLVSTPLFSGFTGPALYVYTRQLTRPDRPASLKWLWLGLFGTTYTILSLTIPNGLTYATEAIVHNRPYWHPLLSPFMAVQSAQLSIFILTSTFLITKACWTQSRPDLRQSQFWLLVTCWTCVVSVTLTNVLPSFRVLLTQVEPALVTLPIAAVGALSVRALGNELQSTQLGDVEVRDTRMDSLGRMARGLAHDLNNMLAAVIGHAEIAKIKSSPESPVGGHLNQIIENSQRAADLLNRMMTYSGRIDPQRDAIHPKGPIQSAFRSLEPLQSPACQMKLELKEGLPNIRIEANDLSTAIDNLLSNAIQALQDGQGRVTLRAFTESNPRVPTDAVGVSLNHQKTLRIEVEDTGRGMSPEQMSRALEPFYSSRPNGKGLGLVNVLSTVKGANGALWMSSKPGAGSRFVIWLPEAKTTPTQTSTGESIPVHRALVVDDDPKVTEILFEILQELGMDVTCCQSGEATVALLEHSTQPIPDIAIVDIRLGAMDGIELGHRLLHHYGFTAILLISGDEPGPRVAQFEGQPVDFVRKPLTVEQLWKSLQSLHLKPPRKPN